MRTEVEVVFDGKDVPGGAQAVLGPAECGSDVATVEDVPMLREVPVYVKLDETDHRLPILLQLLKQHAVDWSEYREDRYTEEELNGARLLIMQPDPVDRIEGGTIRWGLTYDLEGACPACGTGGRQTSPMFISAGEIPPPDGRRAAATHFRHILVDEQLATELERVGATGLSFRSVYAAEPFEPQTKLQWKQLCAERTLPPMSSRTTGLVREGACNVCRRDGHMGIPSESMRIAYRASDLNDIVDVNLSWEHEGTAHLEPDPRDSQLSYPWLLVTPKVMRVIRAAGVTSFQWLPIRVVGDDD